MSRILVTGANGQLIRCISDTVLLHPNLHNEFMTKFFTREQWDVCDHDLNSKMFTEFEPDIYIHGASIHSASDIHENAKLGAEVNIAATHDLIKNCNKHNTVFINFSTDYVFGGRPPVYTDAFSEKEAQFPVNIYGVMKTSIEQMLTGYCERWSNIRVCGLFSKYGSRAKNGLCFPKAILNRIHDKEEVRVVGDQMCTIGYCPDIAEAVMKIINKNLHQMNTHYHIFNSGITTWYEVAKFICALKGYTNITAVKTDDFYENFKRSKNTALQNSHKDLELPSWGLAIIRYLKEIGEL